MTLLKTNEVAKVLRVSLGTARQLVRNGAIKSILVGKRRRVDLGDLTNYLKANGQEAEAEVQETKDQGGQG